MDEREKDLGRSKDVVSGSGRTGDETTREVLLRRYHCDNSSWDGGCGTVDP